MKIKRRNYRLIRLNMVFGAIIGMSLGSFLVIPEELAGATGANSSINVGLEPTISIATDDSQIALELDPGAGDLGTGSTGVLVNTNSSTGYTVYIAANDSETALTPEAESISTQIPALTVTTSEANFPANRWGYYNIDSGLFAGVPASGSQTAVLHREADATTWVEPEDEEAAKFNLTVGARANADVEAGDYSNTVILTAVANE